MPSIFRDKIYTLAVLLKYFPIDFEGYCAGFTMKWIEASITQENERFTRRIVFLSENVSERKLIEEINQVKTKVKKGLFLSAEEFDLLEIPAFYEGIALYQRPDRYSQLFNTSITQVDIDRIAGIVTSNTIFSLGGLTTLHSEAGIFTQEEMKSYLNHLAEKIEYVDYPPQTIIGLELTDHSHVIGLTYQTRSGIWTFMDINQWPSTTFKSANNQTLVENIFAGFQFDHQGLYITLNIKIISTSNHQEQWNRWNSINASCKHIVINRDVIGRFDDQNDLVSIAAGNGHVDLITNLAMHGASMTRSGRLAQQPIHIAAQRGHECVIDELIRLGVDPNITTKYKNITPLYFAASYGHVGTIAKLYKLGANTNMPTTYNGQTPVFAAACKGHVGAIEQLYQCGANLDTSATNGQTPVFAAAYNGHVDAIEKLYKCGANLNTPANNGQTPFFIAVCIGHVDVVLKLAELGADVNAQCNIRDDTPATPIMVAAHHGNVHMVNTLVNLGADVNIPRSNGETSLFIAIAEGRLNVVRYLLSRDDIKMQAAFFTADTLTECVQNCSESMKNRVREFIQLKLSAGASKDKLAVMPAEIAYLIGNSEILVAFSNYNNSIRHSLRSSLGVHSQNGAAAIGFFGLSHRSATSAASSKYVV